MKQPEAKNNRIPAGDADASAGAQALAAAFGSAFRLLVWAVAALLAVTVFQCCVVVDQHQNGIVYRFGRPVRVMQPGQRAFVLPAPVGEFKAYTVSREQSVESRTHMFAVSDSERLSGVAEEPGATLRPGLDGYLITGDRNIVHCVAAAYYQVAEPLLFYEGQRDAAVLLRTLLDNAVLEAVGAVDARAALLDLTALADSVKRRLARRVEALALGAVVNRVTVRCEAPRQVRQAFTEHGEAGQVADRIAKQAQSYATTTLNEAESRTAQILAEANAAAERQVQQARARAENFTRLLAEYRQNPEVVKRDLYNRTIRKVLAGAEEVFVVQEKDGREVRILLEREAGRPAVGKKP